jgi:GH15 family glucan-1,4-alpha-glucosidase
MAGRSIADYAAIGDGRSVALVSRSGSIDWLCWPRFDSPSLFGALLDAQIGGRWALAPDGSVRTRRHYVAGSNVLVTELESEAGTLQITDLMPVCSEEEKHHLLVPEHEVLRIVDCVRGELDVAMHFEPRPGYARKLPRLLDAHGLGIRIEDGAQLYSLRADVPITLHGDVATSRFGMRAGERHRFSLTYDAQGPAVLPPLGSYADEAVRRSIAWWQAWAERCTYRGPHREAVLRSLLVLKLLAYAPSGAIVAAPTTSLPERLGGDLNWDYRYCWIRDASLTVDQLFALGYADEALAFVSWLLHGTRLTRPRLSVLYDVHGGLPSREQVLAHLDGFADSRPVRIRNAATGQSQLDTYGEVVDAVAKLCRYGCKLDRETQRMLRQFGAFVCEHWHEPDHGIWEPRSTPQHHTHSRVLCWTALDRLLALERAGHIDRLPRAALEEHRTRIRRDVEQNAWNEAIGSYTQVLGGHGVDASLLLLPLHGFTPEGDPRMRSTFRRIVERLGAGPGLLYRYEESRGAGEGAFGICSFWAVTYLARGGGTLGEAEAWFEQLLGYTNDVGILAEEIDPTSGAPLGNVPQAFTHVGLIGAALALEARRAAEQPRPRAAGAGT